MAGQGSQYPGMAKDLYESIPAVREIFDEAEGIRPGTLAQMFEGTEEELKRTDNTQPCLFLADVAAAVALREQGIKPNAVAGFSLGEIAGLAVSGAMTVADAFRLVVNRGARMQQAAEQEEGSMIAVLRMDQAELCALCEQFGVYPVNFNCPGQIVVSGRSTKIEELRGELDSRGVRYVALAVGGPFHTPYMKNAAEGLLADLKSLPIGETDIPLYANRTALPYPDNADSMRALISEQICGSVRWEETLRRMYEDGIDTFVECGPGKTLSGFVRRTLSGVAICGVSDIATLTDTVAKIGG